MKLLTGAKLLVAVLLFGTNAFCQGIARQSINAYGSATTTASNVLIEQSAGQSQTVNDAAHAKARSGFIQSRTFHVEQTEKDRLISGTVFPNPAKESFEIQLDQKIEGGQLVVHGLNGERLHSEKINDFRGQQLSSASWSSGIYFVTIQSEKGALFKRKLIITK
ncbi:MAG: T9SS type A sorting domain-containing protein [Bacteroidota bacterium]